MKLASLDLGALVQESPLSSDSHCDLHMTSGLPTCKTRPQDKQILDPLSTTRSRESPFYQESQAVFPFLEATAREMHFNLDVFAKNK